MAALRSARRRTALAVALTLPLLLAAAAAAQRPHPRRPEGRELEVPPRWEVRTVVGANRAEVGALQGAEVFFVTMTPGWRVTTQSTVLLWHPESVAQDLYRLEAEIHLVDPHGSNQGFGLLAGGVGLDSAQPRYDVFLVRPSGEFALEGHAEANHEVIAEWTPHPAVHRFEAGGTRSVSNRLAIDVDTAWVSFEVNGQRVARLERDEANTDGLAGLWVGGGLDLHVSDLQIFPKRAAP